MSTIEVRMPTDMTEKLGNEVLANVRTIKRLREAGVPIVGSISILGVSQGTLQMSTDEGLDGDDYVFRWTPPTNYKPPKSRPPVVDDDEL